MNNARHVINFIRTNVFNFLNITLIKYVALPSTKQRPLCPAPLPKTSKKRIISINITANSPPIVLSNPRGSCLDSQ